MKHVLTFLFCFTAAGLVLAAPPDTPPLETFILDPIELQHLAIWVPADQTGPEINRSCRIRTACSNACTLPSAITHTRADDCPPPLARFLALYTWPYHRDSLPLTIMNGWQWTGDYNLAQLIVNSYDLPAHGGSWENCLEAIFSQTAASLCGRWLTLGVDHKSVASAVKSESSLIVKTFPLLRTRYGYPKERLLR
jgi:hypothetical protein